jgi:hypothetical protein
MSLIYKGFDINDASTPGGIHGNEGTDGTVRGSCSSVG